MKKSKMAQVLANLISEHCEIRPPRDEYEGYGIYIGKGDALAILDGLEKAGMEPPARFIDCNDTNMFSKIYKWEPENV